MVTLLDCIERIPAVIERILKEQDSTFGPFMEWIQDRIGEIDELVFVGSGTSNTVAMTSWSLVEKMSGLRTKVVLPNDYLEETRVYNSHALHVFTSQSGTSKEVCRVMEKLKALGYLCVSMTDSDTSLLAGISPIHICLNCGVEEYGQRTIGYTASVLNHLLLALRLGLARGFITKAQYEDWQAQAARVPDSHREITAATKVWYKTIQRQLMRARCIVFTGAGALYGVALEAAVKFWEMPQVISMGYELEEGLHGPNYGYDTPHCVIVLNDGGKQSDKALSLARYMKEVFHNGLVVGAVTADERDFVLMPKSGDFACLEFSAVPQVLAYYFTEDGGRDLTKKADHRVMNSYFRTHSDTEQAG